MVVPRLSSWERPSVHPEQGADQILNRAGTQPGSTPSRTQCDVISAYFVSALARRCSILATVVNCWLVRYKAISLSNEAKRLLCCVSTRQLTIAAELMVQHDGGRGGSCSSARPLGVSQTNN